MKTPIVLGLLLLFAACNKTTPPEAKSTSAIGGDDSGSAAGGTSGGAVEVSAPVVGTLNYNQLNMTYSKLTGINSSKVNDDFEIIKGSLPSSNDIDAMTSFNLVSKVRLADAYCGLYIGTSATNGLPDSLVSNDSALVDHLLAKFTDYDPGNEIYDDLKLELGNIMKNMDGQNGVLIPNGGQAAAMLNRNLGILACIATLASSHVTLIE